MERFTFEQQLTKDKIIEEKIEKKYSLIKSKINDLIKDGSLTKEGKKFAKDFFEELIRVLTPDLKQNTDEENLKYLGEKNKQIFMKFKEIAKDDLKSIKFISLLEKSFHFRLEKIKQIKYLDEIKNSQSPFLELLAVLKEYYPNLPEKFVENFSLAFFLKTKKFIEKLADELIENQGIKNRNLLISLLERKFIDIAINKIKTKEQFSEKIKIKSVLEFEEIKSEINIEEILKSQEKLYQEVQKEIIKVSEGEEIKKSSLESEELVKKINPQDIPDVKTNDDQSESVSIKIMKNIIGLVKAAKEKFSETKGKLIKKSLPIILSSIIGISSAAIPGILTNTDLSSKSGVKLPLSIKTTMENLTSLKKMKEILEKKFTEEDLNIKTKELINLGKDNEGLLELYPGQTFYLEDFLIKIKQLLSGLQKQNINIDPQILAKNIRFLTAPYILYPGVIKFQLISKNSNYFWQPLDYLSKIEVKKSISGDDVFIGNELETVLGSIQSAKKGKKVILVYDGALGGLISADGGNMRFFDFVENATRTPEMKEIFNELRMVKDKKWVVPKNISQQLEKLLSKYPNITLIKTRTLNSLDLKKDNNQISKIITEEGIEITATNFIDSTPDGIISQKAGIPFDIETLNISYGVVFDINNLSSEDIEKLAKISKEDLLKILNLTEEQIRQDPELSYFYEQFLKNLNKPQVKRVGFHTRYGYQPLGIMIDMYLKLKSREDNIDKIVPEINKRRICQGFNIAIEESDNGKYIANLNGLSYNSEKSYHQGDHNLQTDNDPLTQVVRYDLGKIEELLKKLLTKDDITVRIPKEFYVRQATKVFYTPNTLTYEKFKQSKGEKKFSYGYDARGLQNRFTIPGDNSIDLYRSFYKVINEDYKETDGNLFWNINALHTKTNIENLFVVNKGGGVEPALVPTYRIIQNLMLVMSELVENIDNKDYFNQDQIVTEDVRLTEARQKYYGDYYRHFEELEFRINLAQKDISNNLPTINFQDGKLIINYPLV